MFSFLKGIGLGATAFYFFDPVAGTRRRSLMRDQFVAMGHTIEDFIERGSRDLTNRVNGFVARMSSRCMPEQTPSNETLAERVRSTMGRYVSHPRAIHVEVEDGRIILQGEILAGEVGPLLAAIRRVKGVHEISNELNVYDQADTPSLQGPGRHVGQRPAGSLHYASPGAQLLAASIGTVLVAGVAIRQRPMSVLACCVGCGLLLSAMQQNRSTSRSDSGGQSFRGDPASRSSQWEFTAHS